MEDSTEKIWKKPGGTEERRKKKTADVTKKTERKSKRKGKTVCCTVAWRRNDFIFRVVILRK